METGRKRFGEFLIEKGKINLEQLDQATNYRLQHAELKIGEVLSALGLMPKEDVLKELSLYLNKKYILLDKISMPQDLKDIFSMEFMRANKFAPFECDGEKLKIAIEDIDNYEIKADIDFIALKKSYITEYYLSMGEMIRDFLNNSFTSRAPMKKDMKNLVEYIIDEGVRRNSSDIHIEPVGNEKIRVRYRIDGALVYSNFNIPKDEYDTFSSRIKVLANLNTTEKRRPQDGHIPEYQTQEGKVIDIRVSTILVEHGEKIVLRLLNKRDKIKGLSELGFDDDQIILINKNINKKSGAVYVTGSTGSGKTETLYTLLNMLNKLNTNIITIENPIEKSIEGLNQININESFGMSFSNTLRSVLRQDPDIIMVGEIRDKETFAIAVEASMTGHLVLTTLHANSAVKIIDRVTTLGIDSYNFATSLSLVISQRLIKKLCPFCKEKYTPSTEEFEYMEEILGKPIDRNITVFKDSECGRCNRGYSGREIIAEVFESDDTLERMILNKNTSQETLEYLETKGFKSMAEQGINKILQGVTSISEIKSIFPL